MCLFDSQKEGQNRNDSSNKHHHTLIAVWSVTVESLRDILEVVVTTRRGMEVEVAFWYGRVFPSKTLRNVPAFARANAQAKEKGGGVIPESGCEVGVAWM